MLGGKNLDVGNIDSVLPGGKKKVEDKVDSKNSSSKGSIDSDECDSFSDNDDTEVIEKNLEIIQGIDIVLNNQLDNTPILQSQNNTTSRRTANTSSQTVTATDNFVDGDKKTIAHTKKNEKSNGKDDLRNKKKKKNEKNENIYNALLMLNTDENDQDVTKHTSTNDTSNSQEQTPNQKVEGVGDNSTHEVSVSEIESIVNTTNSAKPYGTTPLDINTTPVHLAQNYQTSDNLNKLQGDPNQFDGASILDEAYVEFLAQQSSKSNVSLQYTNTASNGQPSNFVGSAITQENTAPTSKDKNKKVTLLSQEDNKKNKKITLIYNNNPPTTPPQNERALWQNVLIGVTYTGLLVGTALGGPGFARIVAAAAVTKYGYEAAVNNLLAFSDNGHSLAFGLFSFISSGFATFFGYKVTGTAASVGLATATSWCAYKEGNNIPGYITMASIILGSIIFGFGLDKPSEQSCDDNPRQ